MFYLARLGKEPKWYLRDWASIEDAGQRAETFLRRFASEGGRLTTLGGTLVFVRFPVPKRRGQ